jgi:asparagine synthase (glutamine-hydrolysing)
VHRSFFNENTPEYVRALLTPESIKEVGLFKCGPIEQLVRKIESGAGVGETDDMALAGILSTQLTHQLFVKDFRRQEPVSSKERIKVCRLTKPLRSNPLCVSQKSP